MKDLYILQKEKLFRIRVEEDRNRFELSLGFEKFEEAESYCKQLELEKIPESTNWKKAED